jgi:anti-sigma regulatory factor (Ser/Thr protein kinase)
MSSRVPPAQQSWSFPFSTDSPHRARVLAVEWANGLGVDGELRDIIAVVVSELATNAVRHAQTSFALSCTLRPPCVVVAVTDDSDSLPEMRHPGPDDIGGRGLLLVDHLSSGWRVDPFPGGKTVSADLPLAVHR